MPLTTLKPQNTDTNGIHHATWTGHYYSLVQKLQHIRLPSPCRLHILNNYAYNYTCVSGCVHADSIYNLILIFTPYYAPWTWPWSMTRETHGILKAALHSRLSVVIVWGTYNYRYLASFPSSCIAHNDTMIIQVYY